jgi:hypothetical protein
VLVLGCGRSGTSIFGELFEALPGYRYRSEPTLEDLVAASIDRPDASSALAAKVPRVHPDHPAPIGLPLPLDAMVDALRSPALIWVVRHPLDAIASLRVGIADGWGHHPRPPDWEAWLDRPLVERCAHHWASINGAGWEAVASEVAAIVRFEDLIAAPEDVARDVADLVGADADHPEVEAWWRRVRDRDDEHFVEAVTSRRRSRPDHSVRVGRWRENLSDEDVQRAVPIVTGAAARFGYDLPGWGPTA